MRYLPDAGDLCVPEGRRTLLKKDKGGIFYARIQ